MSDEMYPIAEWTYSVNDKDYGKVAVVNLKEGIISVISYEEYYKVVKI